MLNPVHRFEERRKAITVCEKRAGSLCAVQETMTSFVRRSSLDGGNRRSFLRAGIMAGLAAPILAGCRAMQTRDLICVLGWVPDVEYADLWVAREKG